MTGLPLNDITRFSVRHRAKEILAPSEASDPLIYSAN
jgi:hypothetical protein